MKIDTTLETSTFNESGKPELGVAVFYCHSYG
jgi:hypothetical protein